jgi:glycine cleavage system H protein
MKFAKSHEWASLENNIATVGISDYAQKQLGDIVFIELPDIGDQLSQGSQLGTIESTKAASELYAPLTGEVIEVNSELVNNPQWINESAFEKGWMVKIKVQNATELDALMDEAAYQEYTEKESH